MKAGMASQGRSGARKGAIRGVDEGGSTEDGETLVLKGSARAMPRKSGSRSSVQ